MKCAALKANGDRCRAHAQRGADLCFAHGDRRGIREAGRRGGLRGRQVVIPPGAPDIPLNCPNDATRALEFVFNELLRDRISPQKARVASTVTAVFLRAWEAGDLQKQFRELEARLDDLKGRDSDA